MYKKIVINSLFLIGLFAVQISFISALPGHFKDINLVLIALVFLIFLNKLNQALYWSIVLGFLLDIFSFLPFGLYILALPATAVIVIFLQSNFFTNRSLYSFLALTFFAVFCSEVIINVYVSFLGVFIKSQEIPVFDRIFLYHKLSELFLNLVVIIVLFYASNFFSDRFKPVLLKKNF